MSDSATTVGTAGGPEKVLIVGAGIMGLSIAWALARQGLSVEVFDQGPIPNPVSSSHDEHRINRHAYGKLTGYARMMPQAFKAWDAMWADLGVSHFEATGGVYVLRHEDGWYESTKEQLGELGVPFNDLALDEVVAHYPMLRPDGIERAVFVGGSGLLFPTRILTDLVVHLSELGVRFHARSKVSEVDPERGTVTTAADTFSGDAVVVAAGAWVGRLVPSFAASVTPSRQAVLYLAPPPEMAKAWRTAPVIVVREKDAGLYALPPRRGTRLKIGDHRFSLTGDPDEDRAATEEDIAPVWNALVRAYRDMDAYTIIDPKACFYTVTADETFKVAALGGRGWAVSACSGHGFKLAPLIASGTAAAVRGLVPSEDVSDWAAARAPHRLKLFDE
ncbi:NAD(P)/FAD-dependent oxidoreductase [Acuticoccus mangrovi]|uniref:FAD-dependent oxidoreductase n=1 Tax=Acuticoccus mangrovi TaxID=2796142 RepID=A0A934MND0_9HYPH|nr:FAD-dependent oxidoreductase [Acuticoccus mangrovi]MBJ3778079.1 FAD-dependent oxidoreductase [Acuticoccus mangrovi]